MRNWVLALFLFFPLMLSAEPLFDSRTSCNSLLYDLEIARYWDEKMEQRLPLTFNHILSTGYFTTPSARMGCAGEIGVAYADAPPYDIWSVRIQPFFHFELTGNYRIYRGIEDEGLSPQGFCDHADRGANIKWALMLPEETCNSLPGLAIGVEDFMGAKKFTNYFIVGTKIWIDYGLETSLGWGTGRYTHGPSRGFFGGIAWFPFWDCSLSWLENFSLAAEYDPIDYKNPHREPHPDGRSTQTPINFGAKYSYQDLFYFSVGCIRGKEFAAMASVHYNWGEAEGFFPKVLDPLPYTAPWDIEPLGCHRPESLMIQELNYALEGQGFLLTQAYLEEGDRCDKLPYKRLWISVINQRYRKEHVTRDRIEHLLAALTPCDIDEIRVTLESYGLPCQQYTYSRALLCRYAKHQIAPYEFDLLTPRHEVTLPCADEVREIFYRRLDPWRFKISPRAETFFGRAKGKFKYDLGVKADLEGFLKGNVFYELQVSYTLLSSLNDINDFDWYNPSQLPNVLTDYIKYRQKQNFTTDKAYVQKSWNLNRGIFARAALGYFQVNYAGLAGEILYYPANRYYALGIDGAILKKRSYHGLGFQSKLRKFHGFTPEFIPYTTLQQYFFNLYLDIPEWKIAGKVGVGQFLARDKGARLEVTRYFDSGFRFTAWLTYTNAGDKIHGETYYNRGIALEIPLDFFSRCSNRRVWNYGLAAWLRDAGAFTTTGRSLFDIINRERRES